MIPFLLHTANRNIKSESDGVINWFHNKLGWRGWLVEKPKIYIRQYWDEEFTQDADLPF